MPNLDPGGHRDSSSNQLKWRLSAISPWPTRDVRDAGGPEAGGHQVTHVLLQQGHMRGRREVAIPIGAVTKIGTLAARGRPVVARASSLHPEGQCSVDQTRTERRVRS